MVHLNKARLPAQQQQALFAQLNKTMHALAGTHPENFMAELLGPEEQTMLAKRLAIIILLLEGNSLYRISKILKISPTTAQKLKRTLEQGGYANLLKVLGKNKKNYFAILETIDNILHLGGILPHYNGLDRYKF